jgi:hypothetical protein
MIEIINNAVGQEHLLEEGNILGFHLTGDDETHVGQLVTIRDGYCTLTSLGGVTTVTIPIKNIRYVYAVLFGGEGCFLTVVDGTLMAAALCTTGGPDLDDGEINWVEVDEFSDINCVSAINETFGTCYV